MKKIKHEDRAHAWLSPSSWHRYLERIDGEFKEICLGGAVKSEGLHSEPGPAALDGTECHEWSEHLRQAAQSDDPNEYASLLIEYQNKDSPKAEAADSYIDFLDDIKTRFQNNSFTDYEEYFEVKGKWTKNIWGTLDFAVTRNSGKKWEAVICDLKYGFTEVSAENNPQLIIYLICLEEKLGIRFDRAWLYIYQPRIPREKPYDKFKITKDDLALWRNEILKIEKKILLMKEGKLELEFKAGDHCKWCPYKLDCYAHTDHMRKDSLAILDDIEIFPDIQRTNIDNLVKLHKKKKEIEHYLEDVDHYLLMRGLRGEYIGDLKIVEGRSQRKWISDEAKIVKTLRKHNIDPYSKKLINFGKAEKIVGKKVINSLTTKPQGKLQLASLEDSRPSAQLGKDSLELVDELN